MPDPPPSPGGAPGDRAPRAAGLTRRQVLPFLGASGLAGLTPAAPAGAAWRWPAAPSPRAEARFVYVGTYTAPHTAPDGWSASTALGIYVYRMDPRHGGLTLLHIAPTENPSFLALDPTQAFLYCINERGIVDGAPAGGVTAFAIDPANGALAPLNAKPTNGTYPTHLSVHPSGQHLLAANFGTGNCPVYALQADGSIGPMTADAQLEGNGRGPNPARQDGAHAHQILTDPAGGHVFAVDFGGDRVVAWTLDPGTGALAPNTVPYAPVHSGSGCRHMAFHPGHAVAYVLCELASTVSVFLYDLDRGSFTWLQTLSTLPASLAATVGACEIRVHPAGHAVYVTNRWHGTIAMFSVDPETGTLALMGWESTRGLIPRGMNIDPSGSFLYAANQNSNTIVVFHVRPFDGRLQRTRHVVQSPTPVDVAFGPPA